MPAPFDPSAEIEWSPVWSLRDQRFRYLPTSLLYFFYSGPGRYQVHADSNGCAAGNTLEEAIVQGFLELVERDAYAIWWYNRSQRAEVDLGQFDDPYIRDLQNPACRNRTPALAARRHQRSRDSDLHRDRALDGRRAGICRIRFRRPLRCAHRRAARDDRAQSISVHRSHGRRARIHRAKIEPCDEP